ncbi:MAG: ribonuclease HI [Myxococcota bacterium]|nr:ribonuclease HI [Myxococcota bacterium]
MPDLLTPEEVLARFTAGPDTGIFTDGSCDPNPGSGGWGLVWVEAGKILEERSGREADTTNNRMELRALIEALELLAEDAQVSVYSDSQLCVKTINEWAAGWEARGWKRKTGPIKNLDLVKRLWALAQARPGVELKWIKAHDGSLWNEYADALASAYLRG